MNYRLHRDGQNLGSFSLDELRRRREAGELNGSEFVWCEGMADWEGLDNVLQRSAQIGFPSLPPPIPASARRDGLNPAVLVAIICGVCVFIGGLSFIAYKAVKSGRGILPVVAINRPSVVSPTGQSGYAAAAKKVVWTSNTWTAADVAKRGLAFRQRQWIEGYEQRGDHTEACDAEALKYLKFWLTGEYGSDVGTHPSNIAEWSDKLANDPACTDPLVLTVTGLNAIGHQEQVDRLERALQAYPASKHRAYLPFYATVTLAAELGGPAPRIQALDASALDLLKRSFADGSFQPDDQAECAEMLSHGWGQGFFNRNEAAVSRMAAALDSRYEWLSLVLEGGYHIDEAWKARGSGYADSVTAQGWQGFAAQLAEARRCLTKAWSLHPELPLAPALMMRVCLGDSDIGEMRLWFDRAVTDQIDYAAAWSQMRWGLRPRWYGDLDSMLAFGSTAVNTGRFDTDVPRKLIDVVDDLDAEAGTPPGVHLFGRSDIWPEIQRMYEGYIAAPLAVDDRDGWRSAYCVVAYFGGKYDAARAQLEALDWKPHQSNLNGWNADLSLLPGEVAARTGSSRAMVVEAENARDLQDIAKAAKIYGELLSASGTDARTRDFARSRFATLSLEQKLNQGGWVDLLPHSDDDPNWVYSWGQARVVDGALEARSADNGHLFYSRARVGRDFEVKGEFEVAGPSNNVFGAGIILGVPDTGPDSSTLHWYSFRVRRNQSEGDVASFGRGWTTSQVTLSTPLIAGRNTFDFMLHGDACAATVNGRAVFRNTRAPRTIDVTGGDFFLGLGSFKEDPGTVIRYRDLEVRKAPRTPAR